MHTNFTATGALKMLAFIKPQESKYIVNAPGFYQSVEQKATSLLLNLDMLQVPKAILLPYFATAFPIYTDLKKGKSQASKQQMNSSQLLCERKQ